MKYYQHGLLETCDTIDVIKDLMRYEGVEEMEIEEMKPEVNGDHYWCTEFQDFGERGDGSCGKCCLKYKPRNGKSGICRHSRHTMTGTGKKIVLRIKL